MSGYDIDETTLNAYVDGQLDPELQQAVLYALNRSARLREEAARLRMTKDWMQAGFAATTAPQRSRVDTGVGRRRWLGTALAASLATLAVGAGAGLLGYWCAGIQAGAQPHRVVLHLDRSERTPFRALLDYAEAFLRRNSKPGAQVEVVANASGIALLTSGVSPYEARVRAMMQRYPNLHFVACANSIRQLLQTGREAVMISDVRSSNTAVEHIVARLSDGWSYRKIDDLDAI